MDILCSPCSPRCIGEFVSAIFLWGEFYVCVVAARDIVVVHGVCVGEHKVEVY